MKMKRKRKADRGVAQRSFWNRNGRTRERKKFARLESQERDKVRDKLKERESVYVCVRESECEGVYVRVRAQQSRLNSSISENSYRMLKPSGGMSAVNVACRHRMLFNSSFITQKTTRCFAIAAGGRVSLRTGFSRGGCMRIAHEPLRAVSSLL